MSRSPHYARNTNEYKERSMSPPHRRYTYRTNSPNSPRHMSQKMVYREQDSDYSGDERNSRHSRHSYSNSESDGEYYHRDKGRDYERGRDRDRDRRDKERSRSREYRDRHHHKDKDYDHHRDRSRRDRRDRRRDGRRSRDHDRTYRDDDDGRDRSPQSGFDTNFYKNQPPNNTIMIRGLAQHITENDVRQDIINCGLMPKDIRLIRKKDTGASRGFAFVEFTTLQEAMRWMEMKQGVLMLQDLYRAIMQYSIPKDNGNSSDKPPSTKATADWFCIKCGAQNFKRRDNCFKCHASRMESEEGGSGSDEVCTYATKTIMLRNLDALTTEDSVMAVLKGVVPDLVITITGVCIGRDPLTSTSRGICYLSLETTIDALALYGALTSLEKPLSIDGKTAIISYCKYHMGDVKQAFTPQVQFPSASQSTTYTMDDLNSLADYSASRYAKTAAEYQQYFQYYKMYFAQQITEGASITLNSENQMDSANAAAALAQNAMLQRNSKALYDTNAVCMLPTQIPNGTDGKKYPVPEVDKYIFDKNTGYFYDTTTGLYYDRNSQYYYNSFIQKYLYWDPEKFTYVLAPTVNTTMNAATTNYSGGPTTSTTTTETTTPDTKKQKVEKQDKVKVAKKIAKDMARWAKSLNQKKDYNRTPAIEPNGIQNGTSAASADIGFAVLEKKSLPAVVVPSTQQAIGVVSPSHKAESILLAKSHASEGLVAAYGSDTSGEEDNATEDNIDCLDWQKLVCLLCKRQFFSKEDLARHQQVSALHKKNLELLYLQKSLEGGKKLKYRDRAKERRLKYGESDDPQPSKLKEKYLKAREIPDMHPVMAASSNDPIGSENVGNKLLQKMGWTEGQGLGKSNQGRTSIIQAEQRVSSVGLGSKVSAYTALPGETYKDCVKKMMFARYQELSEQN